ncbi:MAG: prepilin-type N-terminal cleavage/methylation domain-containing protein [Phycisphaerales bacterium]|nr:prepilin-type N-terminal cleavage/methylation domain-containing protein [Phycisphaerales bacterium]
MNIKKDHCIRRDQQCGGRYLRQRGSGCPGHQRHWGISGFTLLEVILATAMVAVIAAALYTALATAFQARRQASRQVDAMRQASIITNIIRQDFESILPPDGTLSSAFVGDRGGDANAASDWVEFYALQRDDAAASDDPLAEGARRITLQLRTDVQPAQLVRLVEPNLLSPVEREAITEVLSEHVRALALRYYSSTEGWVEQWDSDVDGQVLPRAVEVTLTFDSPSPVDGQRPYQISQIFPLSTAVDSQSQEQSIAR